MDGKEHDADRDDLEIEIVDIRDGDDADASQSGALPSAPSSFSLRSPRFSPRQRATQVTITIGVIVVALLVILGSYAPARSVVTGTFVPPTPSTILATQSTVVRVYFDATPSWGQLFIDGTPVAHAPLPGEYAPLSLTNGLHRLSMRVDPFQPQDCTLSMPPVPGKDSCQLSIMEQSQSLTAWLLSFPLSLADLPDAQRIALEEAAQSALNAQAPDEMIMPGEAYAVDAPGYRQSTTRQPVKATLHFQLDTDANPASACATIYGKLDTSCSFHLQDCHLFCTASDLFPASAQDWDVLSVVRFSWDYATIDGKFIAQGQPESTRYEHLVPLQIRWDGTRWHVKPFFADPPGKLKPELEPVCASAMSEVQGNPALSYIQPEHLGVTWNYISASNSANDCLGVITPNVAQEHASSPLVAYCLYRFGVFVAVNATAHRFWPDMLVADEYEQHIAQQLIMQYHGTAT